MDSAQLELFGSFPRRVGTPSQHWVFTEAQVDLFLETISGNRNAYVTVNRLPIDGSGHGITGLEADKVFFDFDGDKSALPDGDETPADVAVTRMRDDPDLADDVLGDAVSEARELAERSVHDGVPVMGVFSGFGVHVHQLYQATDEGVQTKQGSTARRYIDLLDLETADEAVIDNGQRICRMPNVERTTYEEKESFGGSVKVADGRGTGLWTVPLDEMDLTQMTVQSLLEWSEGPRENLIDIGDRPEMGVFTDYVEDLARGEDGWREAKPVEERDDGPESDARVLLEELIRMPCMVERLDQPNPSQTIRVNGAVMLFNVGLTPQEVCHLFRRLNWTDYDRKTTMKHLKHIYKNGYSDQSCWTLRRKGMCVVDDATDCPTHGWGGGRPEWKA